MYIEKHIWLTLITLVRSLSSVHHRTEWIQETLEIGRLNSAATCLPVGKLEKLVQSSLEMSVQPFWNPHSPPKNTVPTLRRVKDRKRDTQIDRWIEIESQRERKRELTLLRATNCWLATGASNCRRLTCINREQFALVEQRSWGRKWRLGSSGARSVGQLPAGIPGNPGRDRVYCSELIGRGRVLVKRVKTRDR